jgi:hypothetical protein
VWQGRVSNGFRRSRSMSIELLREQLQENIITILDDYQGYDIDSLMIDKICQIVVDTFKEFEV